MKYSCTEAFVVVDEKTKLAIPLSICVAVNVAVNAIMIHFYLLLFFNTLHWCTAVNAARPHLHLDLQRARAAHVWTAYH